ncbi:MAG TPA: hypothetical protein VK101_05000 [Limnochordia bacterium]|nr:hypothetical protein [Limnochordia bacterium]
MMSEFNREMVERLIAEIDELLALRQGFTEAYREWRETALDTMIAAVGEERAAEMERLGPRQSPINRQHRVHIYRQRLHAQRKYLTDLLEAEAESES